MLSGQARARPEQLPCALADRRVRKVDASVDAEIDAPSSGLLLDFGLESIAGDVTTDSVNGVIASCMGTACPTTRPGRVGSALAFANGAELRIAWNAAFETPAAFTVTAWFFSLGTDGAIFSRPHTQDIWNTWQIEVVNGNGAFTTTDANGTHDKLEGTPLPTDAWTHLAGVWDGTTKALYVDGAVVAAKPWPSVITDSLPLVIGFDINSGVDQLHVTGGIDELRLYNRALSAAEIAALAQ